MHKKDNHIFIRVHAFKGEQYLLHMLFLAIGLCIVGYAYFVSLSILNVIAHKEAIAESERLQSQVGLLEQDYFELSKSVTPALAVQLGMTQTSDTTFVRRPGAVGSAQGAHGL
jgi:hypothetical protein